MKNKTLYTLLFVICVVGFWLFENFYTPATYSDPNSRTDASPVATDFLPSSTTGAIIQHDYFMLSYSEPHEQAEWVVYELKQSHLTYDDRQRPYFIEDPKVATKSADWRNYRGSGYDRGHLCPAGDRRFSEYAYNETFYTSNISPQNREFNAGIWNRLEQKVRFWCKKYGDLTIITGGVLESGLEEIGSEDVDVPNKFYKVIFRKDGNSVKVLCFLIPNKESKKSLKSFLVPIDSIEEITTIDFFKNKSETWQKNLESIVDASGWTF
ncbi:MAG: DNA/RNA non-specific endonuclease [Bacteroidota bacterium]